MVADTLVTEFIDEGERLIDALRANNFPIAAAFWLRISQEEAWVLYIATPEVDAGLIDAYRRYSPIASSMPELRVRDFVRLIGVKNPITTDVLSVYRLYPAGQAIWFRGRQLGGVIIDDAYLYPTTTV